jgi:hypothetical protein
LFAPDKDTLVIYDFMFPRWLGDTRPGPAEGETARLPLAETTCPSCTSILDSFDGAAAQYSGAPGMYASLSWREDRRQAPGQEGRARQRQGEIAMRGPDRINEVTKTHRSTTPDVGPRTASSQPRGAARGRRRCLIGVSALAALAAVLLPSAASAATPQQTVFPINDTFTVSGICAFPIVETAHGTARIIDFTDQTGNVIREIDLTPGLTVSFSANGITLSTVSPSLSHITFNADGTATLTVTGLSGHISVPGQGTVALSAGRFVLLLTDDQPPQILAENGTFSFGHGSLPPIEEQLCSVLS